MVSRFGSPTQYIMGKVKPMKSSEATRASRSILLDEYTLTSNGSQCTPTAINDGTNTVVNETELGAGDDQNIPVICVTSINHPLENRHGEPRKSQTSDQKRNQLASIVKSESLPTSISCDMRPNSASAPSSIGTEVICRICHSEAEPEQPLISPCLCSGTLKYVHQDCLHHWIKSSDLRYCELCKFEFIMKITTKPFSKWQNLEMSPVERRKIICSVTFHVIALTCVIWSLYVLIERTTEEINNGVLEWPFWTKLIVMAIGFVGGVVFMYVQCRMYVGLCRRWRAHNRTFVVKSVPLDVLNEAQKAARHRTATANAATAAATAAAAANAAAIAAANAAVVTQVTAVESAAGEAASLPSETTGPPLADTGLETVVICTVGDKSSPAATPDDTTVVLPTDASSPNSPPVAPTCLRVSSTYAATAATSCATTTATSTGVVMSEPLHPALMPHIQSQQSSSTPQQQQSVPWISNTVI